MDNQNIDSNKSSIRELLTTHGFKFSKSMGQNFLIDANVPEKIVKLSCFDKTCGVLEVGPGLGALTGELAKIAGNVTAVELDKRLVPILQIGFADKKNVQIIQGDILKLDIKKLVDDTMAGLDHHVCANLPYNITTPAITAFIESEMFDSIIVMVQKEVALRICAKPGSPEYGAFTVYANYYTEPEILFDVSPNSFFPRPKVTSAVVRLRKRAKRMLSKEGEKAFFRVVRAAFGQRRKTLVNALHSVFNITHTKEEISEIVVSCGFDVRVRGEVLSVEEFAKMTPFF